MIHINLIKRLRVNKELTQAQLAKACGVSQATVVFWENGKSFPKAAKIPTVARVLECDSMELLAMAEEQHNRVGA